MTRAAIYARYSSDLQSAASIEDQIRECRARADLLGHEVVATYSDAAISGAFLMNRPAINDLIRDARAGKFAVVIAEALDRISRNLADVAKLYEQLTYAGVRIVTIAEGEVTDLHVGLKGTMNALFLKDMAAKVRRGQRGRTEAGKQTCGLAYGYRVVRKMMEDGRVTTGDREIIPEQAAVVIEIFRRYAAGESPRRIARDLNARGIPGPSGRAWLASTIIGNAARGNGILHNEIYRGVLIYNRQSFRKDPSTGRRVPKLNPESEWTCVDVPALRIVSDDLWSRAQAVRRQILRAPASNRSRPKHLLSGLLRCGCCGAPMVKVAPNYFGCSRHKETGLCGNKRKVRQGLIEERILDGLGQHMLDPRTVKAFIEEYRHASDAHRLGTNRHAAELERKIERLNAQIGAIISAIADQLDTPDMRERVRKLTAERDAARDDLAALQTAPVVALHPEAAELYRARLANLRAMLAKEETRQEATNILRGIVAEIKLTPLEDVGDIQVDLTGYLAGAMPPGDQIALAHSFRLAVGDAVGSAGVIPAASPRVTVSFLLRSGQLI